MSRTRTLAIVLPSKGRFVDLVLTLFATSTKVRGDGRCRFYVCAKYNRLQIALLRLLFPNSARIYNEAQYSVKGMLAAFNFLYERALADGCEWLVTWADDLVPERRDWLDTFWPILTRDDFKFGVMSSDEGGHKGLFGWNVFGGSPCAHYYAARLDVLPGHLAHPLLKAYCADNEMALQMLERGVPIHLLPVRVIHQPTQNETRASNSLNLPDDVETVYRLHPAVRGRLDAICFRGDVHHEESRFVPDRGELLQFQEGVEALSIEAFRACAYRPARRLAIRLLAFVRSRVNRSPII